MPDFNNKTTVCILKKNKESKTDIILSRNTVEALSVKGVVKTIYFYITFATKFKVVMITLESLINIFIEILNTYKEEAIRLSLKKINSLARIMHACTQGLSQKISNVGTKEIRCYQMKKIAPQAKSFLLKCN